METTLPPGVTPIGQQPAADAGSATPPAQAAAPAAETFDNGGDVPPGKWNWYKIGTGILLFTLGLMALNYFRERTYQVTADSKEKEKKINQIQSEVSKIKQTIEQN